MLSRVIFVISTSRKATALVLGWVTAVGAKLSPLVPVILGITGYSESSVTEVLSHAATFGSSLAGFLASLYAILTACEDCASKWGVTGAIPSRGSPETSAAAD